MKTWSHPELGRFALTNTGWCGWCTLPSFRTFLFGARGKSKLKLEFETVLNCDVPPSKSECALAQRIIRNEAKLTKLVIEALINDLNGLGDDSGMWWHGDINSVQANVKRHIGKQIHLTDKAAIPQIIGSPSIWIRQEVEWYEKPCGIICFSAAFDPEHGVGVLTDGTRILGTGYQMSVGPFFRYQFRR